MRSQRVEHNLVTKNQQQMFIAALFTIAKSWKQPKCPSADGWIEKIWYMQIIEYYSAIKRMK